MCGCGYKNGPSIVFDASPYSYYKLYCILSYTVLNWCRLSTVDFHCFVYALCFMHNNKRLTVRHFIVVVHFNGFSSVAYMYAHRTSHIILLVCLSIHLFRFWLLFSFIVFYMISWFSMDICIMFGDCTEHQRWRWRWR